MVHQMVGHLVKRGVEMHDTFRKSGGSQHGKAPKDPLEVIDKLPTGLLSLLVVTFFAFLVVVTLVRSSVSSSTDGLTANAAMID